MIQFKGAVVLGQSGVTKSIAGDKTYFGTPISESREKLKEVYDTKGSVNHEFGVKDPMLSHIEALLVNHYQFKGFSVPDIAAMMNVTTSKLERDIKKLTGMTPIKYINDFRLNKAKYMLQQNNKSIFEVSFLYNNCYINA